MTHPPTDSQIHKLSPKNSLWPFFGVKTWSFQRLLVTSNARNQRFVASLFALGDVFSLPFTAWVGPNVDPTLGQTLMGQTQRTSRRAVKPWQWGGQNRKIPGENNPTTSTRKGKKTTNKSPIISKQTRLLWNTKLGEFVSLFLREDSIHETSQRQNHPKLPTKMHLEKTHQEAGNKHTQHVCDLCFLVENFPAMEFRIAKDPNIRSHLEVSLPQWAHSYVPGPVGGEANPLGEAAFYPTGMVKCSFWRKGSLWCWLFMDDSHLFLLKLNVLFHDVFSGVLSSQKKDISKLTRRL